MTQKHVMLALPAYTGTVHVGTMRAIIQDMIAITDAGHKFTMKDDCGNAMIADCRAKIVADFLATDCTDLIFIDSDVLWETGALLKLMMYDVDFVAAIYPQRRDPINFCVRYLPDPEKKGIQVHENGLIEVVGVPAGCMRLSRACLERMVEAYPETEFSCEDTPLKKAWDLFGSYWQGRLKFGEDYSFCNRWVALGGKIWVDPKMKLGHCGTKTFFGSLHEYLIEYHQKEQISTAIERLREAAE